MGDVATERLQFWDSRATLGLTAGTNDVSLKKLEMIHIGGMLTGCRTVLDAGCGNGITACALLRSNPSLRISGFDYSERMVDAARSVADREGVGGRFVAEVGNLLSPPFDGEHFDAVYTERSLINLGTLQDQKAAVSALATLLVSGGRMVLCESFVDGLDEINSFRVPLGLEPITPPWHNRYLRLEELHEVVPDGMAISEVSNFSSTYYFLSRVINAWEAREANSAPSYDAPINQLAFTLPSISVCAQTKIVVMRRL